MRMLLPRSKSDKGKKRKDRVKVHLPVASSSLLSQRYCTFYFFHVMENKDLLSCSGFIKCEPWSKLTYTLLCLKWFVIILEQHPGVHARTLISYAGQYIVIQCGPDDSASRSVFEHLHLKPTGRGTALLSKTEDRTGISWRPWCA